MKPTTLLDIQRTGDLGGEKVDMTLDENSLAHLISVMTDLYSNPELAVVREYSTNARDSHIDAGQTRPIEIETPGTFSPYFKVRDFGLGMDENDIKNVYSKYGASTKRNSDSVVGMLGLGSKSALTYTGQFTIRGVKNGIATTVVVNRKEDGTGVMEIVSIDPVDESNGVEISIPAKITHNFEELSKDFFRFWEPGTVLLNGKPPVTLGGKKITDNIFMVDDLRKDYIVMGNVAYPTNTTDLYPNKGYGSTYGIVCYVEIGEVNFTPSRESLNYTKLTKTTIERLSREFKVAFGAQIQADIDSAPTHSEALNRYKSWSNMVGAWPSGIPTYKGDTLPSTFNNQAVIYKPFADRYQVQIDNYHYIDKLLDCVFVTGFDPVTDREKISRTNKTKLKHWAENNGGSTRLFVMCKNRFGNPWTDDVRTVTWQEIKDIRLPRAPKAAGTTIRAKAPAERFEVYIDRVHSLTDTIDKSKTIIYASPAEDLADLSVASGILNDSVIVSLGKNRWGKFLREYPKAVHLDTALREKSKAVVDALTDDDKMAFALVQCNDGARFLRGETIDDPDIAKRLELHDHYESSPAVKELQLMVNRLPYAYRPKPSLPRVRPVFDKYPLVSGSWSIQANKRHVAIYINAVYNERMANAKV